MRGVPRSENGTGQSTEERGTGERLDLDADRLVKKRARCIAIPIPDAPVDGHGIRPETCRRRMLAWEVSGFLF